MAIDKPLGTENDPNVKNLGSAVEIQPDTSREDQIRAAAEILVSEENLLVDGEIEQAAPAMNFNMNLAEVLPQDILQSISSDLLSSIKGDKQSRSEWEKTYTDGLKYLGMKFDDTRSQPFEGSSGVIHPILAEAVTQFQAQAYKEMLPAKGPVKTEIIGARTVETENQAERVQEFMNYYIMNVMEALEE